MTALSTQGAQVSVTFIRSQSDISSLSGSFQLGHVSSTADTTEDLVNILGKGHAGYLRATYTDTQGLTLVRPFHVDRSVAEAPRDISQTYFALSEGL